MPHSKNKTVLVEVYECVPGNWTHDKTEQVWGPKAGGVKAATADARVFGVVRYRPSISIQRRARNMGVDINATTTSGKGKRRGKSRGKGKGGDRKEDEDFDPFSLYVPKTNTGTKLQPFDPFKLEAGPFEFGPFVNRGKYGKG